MYLSLISPSQQRNLTALGASLMVNLGLLALMAALHYVAKPHNTIPAVPIKLLPAAKTVQLAKPVTPKQRPKQPSPQSETMPPVQPLSKAATPEERPPQVAEPTPKHTIEPLHRLTRLPQFLRRIEPSYPENERAVGKEALGLAEIVIDTRGRILEARIIKSAGADFDQAVLQALEQSLFSPGYIDDKEVVVRFQIPFRFQLR